MSSRKRALGHAGEQLAQDHLRAAGYQIVAANWRCAHGEIDIIASKDGVLVFVEVRTRRSRDQNGALEMAFMSLGPRKQAQLQKLAYHYFEQMGAEPERWRIDVIAVGVAADGRPIIEHMEDALDWSDR